ncbi:MAG: hypothetical protein LAT57_03295 [Balneolales bacterium]|nr:hypothetical protein [Balneolales bacterium]
MKSISNSIAIFKNTGKIMYSKYNTALVCTTMLLIALLMMQTIMPASAVAQSASDEFTVSVKLGARYVANTGVELRLFPERKNVLEAGLRDGFIIERRLSTDANFTEIARTAPLSDEEWEALILSEAEENMDRADNLDLAYAFYQNIFEARGGTFSLDGGIASLREQRANEDFEFAVFILTAVRDSAVAAALGLGYTDTTVQAGQEYEYQVRPAGEVAIYTIVNDPITIRTESDENPYENPVFVYEDDTRLLFQWFETEHVAGYFVERKGPGDDEFVRLNDAPIFNLTNNTDDAPNRGSYKDEDLENYSTYTYRFLGHTMFGELVQFAEVEAMPRDRTPPSPPSITKPQHISPNEVLVEWDMIEPVAPDLFGFVVARSQMNEGDFEIIHPEILAPETRSFVDTTFIEGLTNYYIVQAIDTAYNVSSSFPVAVMLIDTIPPAPPVFTLGTVDSTGAVTLVVELGEERDLMGYRLFRSNDLDHEFSVIDEAFVETDEFRGEIQTTFNDTITLNSLTPEVYYKIKALDFNYNQSDFSEVMALARPDTIPPTTPVFRRAIAAEDNVTLHFIQSQSRDVAAQIIYRKSSMQEEWAVLDTLMANQSVYTDSLVEQNTSYYYSMRAVDFSGNYSEYAFPVHARPYDSGVRAMVENLTVELSDETMRLSWEYPTKEGVFFVIYKQDTNGNIRQHRRTDDFFFEESVGEEGEIAYGVRAFTTDGGQSPLSEMLVVQ